MAIAEKRYSTRNRAEYKLQGSNRLPNLRGNGRRRLEVNHVSLIAPKVVDDLLTVIENLRPRYGVRL